MPALLLLDLTVYGRQETWEDSPDGWPQDPARSWFRAAANPLHSGQGWRRCDEPCCQPAPQSAASNSA